MGLKVLIVGVNSKYIHSSLACWYLKANCQGEHDISIFECSINEDAEKAISKIYEFTPDVIAFSCYIWNIDYIQKLSINLRKLLPKAKQIAGGPEVSFSFNKSLFQFDYVIKGEGELEFSTIINSIWNDEFIKEDTKNFHLIHDLNSIISPYTEEMLKSLGNKILYFESSRGCPFSCSYCLSSTFKGVRFFSLDRVFEELTRIVSYGVKLIKFVDRTFNCNKERAKAIFSHIIDNYEKNYKDTLFHFEVAGDLFDNETIELLGSAPAGLIQFEAGIQSTNIETLIEINRATSLEKVVGNISKLRAKGNINIHLDLIAGLPGESLESFKRSFEDVYILKPHMLQLGFLKMLKGTVIRENADSYGLVFRDYPPYEFLESRDLKYSEVQILKGIEDLVDKFYNSNRFSKTLEFLTSLYSSAYSFYFDFYLYLKNRAFFEQSRSSRDCYLYLFEFVKNAGIIENLDIIKDFLRFDYLKIDNTRNLPEFLKVNKEKLFFEGILRFIRDESNIIKYLPKSIGTNSKFLFNSITIEIFKYDIFRDFNCANKNPKIMYILFDYNHKGKVDGLYESIVLDCEII